MDECKPLLHGSPPSQLESQKQTDVQLSVRSPTPLGRVVQAAREPLRRGEGRVEQVITMSNRALKAPMVSAISLCVRLIFQV